MRVSFEAAIFRRVKNLVGVNKTHRLDTVSSRHYTAKANARMQKARCPQQLGSCRRQAGPASKRSRSIERSEFSCEDNGKNTPGNARKGVIQLMDL